MQTQLRNLITAGLLGLAITAQAEITPEQAARLGGEELTPVGAERAANADGSIPAWTGGLAEWPAGYQPGDRLANPYAEEKPLFEITAANYQQYEDKLSVGQIALLKRYADTYRIPVYQTHRSARLPESEYAAIKAQATKVATISDGNGLVNLTVSVPFPIPANGIEVIWNHVTRYRTDAGFKRRYTQTPVQANGAFSPVLLEESAIYTSRLPDNPYPNRLFVFLQRILAPARLEGDVLLVHENIDQVKEPRSAWIYNAGQRRVRRAPNVAYDGPGTAADGLRTSDDLDMYNGAPDRYDWKLVGKREMYIPYNAYLLRNGSLKYSDIIMPGHLNPEYLRFELHRVWEVEATLKDGARHIYARRTFYIDEDTWQIAAEDIYDGRGELWRVRDNHEILHYHVSIPWSTAETVYDLNSGRYLVTGLDNEESGYQYDFDYNASLEDFTPSALRRAGRR